MSNSRELLNEAIADAKAVKEAAIANAKAALEETFAPYLAEKLKAKIAELDEEGMYEETEMQNEEEELKEKMSNPVMRKDLKGDNKPEMETEKMREADMEEEMNLDELLAELEEEMKTEESVEEAAESLNEEEEAEMETEEEEEIDLEDMSEEDLKALIEDVIEDMVKAGEIEAGENFESDDEMKMDMDMDVEMDSEEEETMNEEKKYGGNKRDIPSAKRGKIKKDTAEEEGIADYEKSKKKMKEEIEETMDEAVMDKLNKVIQRMKDNAAAGRPLIDDEMFKFVDKADLLPAGLTKAKEISEEEMEEMKSKIEELTSTLNEVKLLNAKLLYTNKIFRAKNLTENQKVKVLQAFDKAATVKETKLVFETLATELKEKKAPVNESIRGLASKPAGVAPTTGKQPILEATEQVTRWQKLAGIIKS
jgi:hypothetical protein